jgi:hypothetical protein
MMIVGYEGKWMRKVFEYQKAATDCRKRAATSQDGAEKKALERLATTWELLANTREAQIQKGLIQPIDEYGSLSEDLARFATTGSFARRVTESAAE